MERSLPVFAVTLPVDALNVASLVDSTAGRGAELSEEGRGASGTKCDPQGLHRPQSQIILPRAGGGSDEPQGQTLSRVLAEMASERLNRKLEKSSQETRVL